MKTSVSILSAVVTAGLLLSGLPSAVAAQRAAPYSLEQVKGYPFPNELTAAGSGSRIAWAFNERGLRNLWVAEGPAFAARQLTRYQRDDAQELTQVSISSDGRYIVYVRGGDHGSNWDDSQPVNPAGMPTPVRVQIWSVPFGGGEPKSLGDGENPVISPDGQLVAFEKDRTIWTVPIDGSRPAARLLSIRGDNGDPRWSPDGSRLAFVSGRGDHAFIGVYTNDSTPVQWLDPSTSRDGSPRWEVSDVIASGDRAAVQFVVREFSTRLGRDLLSEQVVIIRVAQGRIVNIVGYYDSSEFRRVFWEES